MKLTKPQLKRLIEQNLDQIPDWALPPAPPKPDRWGPEKKPTERPYYERRVGDPRPPFPGRPHRGAPPIGILDFFGMNPFAAHHRSRGELYGAPHDFSRWMDRPIHSPTAEYDPVVPIGGEWLDNINDAIAEYFPGMHDDDASLNDPLGGGAGDLLEAVVQKEIIKFLNE